MALLATAALSAARSPYFRTFWPQPAGHLPAPCQPLRSPYFRTFHLRPAGYSLAPYLWPQRPPRLGRQKIRSCPEHSSFGPVWPPRTAIARLWPLSRLLIPTLFGLELCDPHRYREGRWVLLNAQVALLDRSDLYC
jgi:hypothetical protein